MQDTFYAGYLLCRIPSDRLADGTRKTVDIGYTWLRFNGRQVMTFIAFNEENITPLLGALTLEELWQGVDPKGRRLFSLTDMPL